MKEAGGPYPPVDADEVVGNLARRRAAEKARRGRAQGGPPAGRDKQGPDPAGVRTKASSGGRAWRQGRREETGRTWRGREAQGPKGAREEIEGAASCGCKLQNMSWFCYKHVNTLS